MCVIIEEGVNLGLRFRSLLAEDAFWLAESANDADVAKYSLSIYPRTEHEIADYLKMSLEDEKEKHVVAELDGEAAGFVSVHPLDGRSRHVAWVGIEVRRKHWGKGVGTALMNEAIRLAKELGCRRLMLGVFKGNERAMRLYEKFGFEIEAYEEEAVYIDGSWRKSYLMGLEIALCEPKLKTLKFSQPSSKAQHRGALCGGITVRQLMNKDLDEINRIQNCRESTKSSYRVPPTTKEATKKWYETIKSKEGKYCIACFKDDKILGYILFRASIPPFANLKFEEIIVDSKQETEAAANALIAGVNGFRERYGYHRIFAYVPQTSSAIINALMNYGFKNAGSMKCYYFIDGNYVDGLVFGYP